MGTLALLSALMSAFLLWNVGQANAYPGAQNKLFCVYGSCWKCFESCPEFGDLYDTPDQCRSNCHSSDYVGVAQSDVEPTVTEKEELTTKTEWNVGFIKYGNDRPIQSGEQTSNGFSSDLMEIVGKFASKQLTFLSQDPDSTEMLDNGKVHLAGPYLVPFAEELKYDQYSRWKENFWISDPVIPEEKVAFACRNNCSGIRVLEDVAGRKDVPVCMVRDGLAYTMLKYLSDAANKAGREVMLRVKLYDTLALAVEQSLRSENSCIIMDTYLNLRMMLRSMSMNEMYCQLTVRPGLRTVGRYVLMTRKDFSGQKTLNKAIEKAMKKKPNFAQKLIDQHFPMTGRCENYVDPDKQRESTENVMVVGYMDFGETSQDTTASTSSHPFGVSYEIFSTLGNYANKPMQFIMQKPKFTRMLQGGNVELAGPYLIPSLDEVEYDQFRDWREKFWMSNPVMQEEIVGFACKQDCDGMQTIDDVGKNSSKAICMVEGGVIHAMAKHLANEGLETAIQTLLRTRLSWNLAAAMDQTLNGPDPCVLIDTYSALRIADKTLKIRQDKFGDCNLVVRPGNQTVGKYVLMARKDFQYKTMINEAIDEMNQRNPDMMQNEMLKYFPSNEHCFNKQVAGQPQSDSAPETRENEIDASSDFPIDPLSSKWRVGFVQFDPLDPTSSTDESLENPMSFSRDLFLMIAKYSRLEMELQSEKPESTGLLRDRSVEMAGPYLVPYFKRANHARSDEWKQEYRFSKPIVDKEKIGFACKNNCSGVEQLEDITDVPGMAVCMVEGGVTHSVLTHMAENNQNVVAKEILRRAQMSYDLAEAIKQTFSVFKPCVLIDTYLALRMALRSQRQGTEYCDLTVRQGKLVVGKYVIMTTKQFSEQTKLNDGIKLMHLRKAAFLPKLADLYYPMVEQCGNTMTGEPSSTTTTQIPTSTEFLLPSEDPFAATDSLTDVKTCVYKGTVYKQGETWTTKQGESLECALNWLDEAEIKQLQMPTGEKAKTKCYRDGQYYSHKERLEVNGFTYECFVEDTGNRWSLLPVQDSKKSNKRRNRKCFQNGQKRKEGSVWTHKGSQYKCVRDDRDRMVVEKIE